MLLGVMGMIKKNLDKDERLNRTSNKVILPNDMEEEKQYMASCYNYKYKYNANIRVLGSRMFELQI